MREAFHAFVRARLPADCRVEFISHKGSPAVSVPFDHPRLECARAALADEWGKPAVRIGSGGSIPIVGDFKRVLGLDSLMVGFALDDDRVHSPNEKYDLHSPSTRASARGPASCTRWQIIRFPDDPFGIPETISPKRPRSDDALEHFPHKWIPVLRKKMRQTRNLERPI